MNAYLNLLNPYPFERLRALFADITPPRDLEPILLGMGEPQHPTPKVITDAITQHLDGLAKYPATKGLPELRQACANWCNQRYGVTLCPESEILPVNGSREALFSFVQATLNTANLKAKPIVLSPNPFYQIYEGATLLAGGEMAFVNTTSPDFLPHWQDIKPELWERVQIVFVCSPGNPTGAVLPLSSWVELFELQEKYHFIIASDECYSEIYFEEKPLGVLQSAQATGRDFSGKVMFTSLSKRSNAPGLRSGFVAGDKNILKAFLQYRTYHGCAMSTTIQQASISAWQDEQHVIENRRLYQEKFTHILPLLQQRFNVQQPDASFYIWLPVPDGDDIAFAQTLWEKAHVQVLPGSFLARDTTQGNAGKGFVRIALVSSLAHCNEAIQRLLTL